MFANTLGLFEDDYSAFLSVPYLDDGASGNNEIAEPSCSVLPRETQSPKSQTYDVTDDNITESPDIQICKQFYTNTCGCDKDQGKSCSSLFPLDHFIELCAQSSLLSHDELDLIIMGFISSAMLDSDSTKDGRHQNPAKRKRLTMSYKHHGVDVCKKTFLFCMALVRTDYRLLKTATKRKGYRYENTKTLNGYLTIQCRLLPNGML